MPLIAPNLFPDPLPPGILHLSGLLDADAQAGLAAALGEIVAAAPLKQPRVRGKGMFSAAITNCGEVGWWSDEKGYRYEATQPGTDRPWPEIPRALRTAARTAAAHSPWPDFAPDACLINFYGPGAKMGLHQDKDERDFSQPIITICLGDSADFLVGGPKRSDRPQAFLVQSGDAIVMGSPSRMLFHGIRRIDPGTSPLPQITGRYSLTFRKAL
jgi:DNA oxidative demethylase